MKTERTREWWLSRARREGDAAVSAGLLALDPIGLPEQQQQGGGRAGGRHVGEQPGTSDEAKIAFARFVELSRRERGMSVERLAEQASLDVADIINIEENYGHRPDPRTVYQLSNVFKVSQQRLMEIAGLSVANDDTLRQEAVRFAARSESVEKLTREQRAALNEFVAVLSRK